MKRNYYAKTRLGISKGGAGGGGRVHDAGVKASMRQTRFMIGKAAISSV